MKEVKKCSISGIAFTLDADAYALLSRYLDSLRATYAETADGDEIVADIEARIAELILSQQENSRVVETPLLRQIISQMGTAEDISSESETERRNPVFPTERRDTKTFLFSFPDSDMSHGKRTAIKNCLRNSFCLCISHQGAI